MNNPAEKPEDAIPEDQPAGHDAASADAAAGFSHKIAALEKELERTKDQMLRALADAENTRRRSQKEREDAGKYAVSSFARDLLDVADNFHRALQSIPAELKDADERVKGVVTGIETVQKEMLRTFEKHGIRKIEPIGEPFNPHFHEVIFEAPVPGKPPGTVIQLIEAGYILNDRLLRPARVGVSKADGSGAGEPPHRIDEQA